MSSWKRGALLSFAACFLLATAAWTKLYLQSQNTLYNNSRWIVQKRMLSMATMGADETLITRAPIAGNAMHFGFYPLQELQSRATLDPASIRFEADIPSGSYLTVLFGCDGGACRGLRLSRLSSKPNALLLIDPLGHFLEKKPIALAALHDGFQEYSLLLRSDGLFLRVGANEMRISPALQERPGRIGFHSGLAGADVRAIAVTGKSGEVFREDFSNTKNWPLAGVSFAALLLAACVACASLLGSGDKPKQWWFGMLIPAAVALLLGVGFCAIDKRWAKLPSENLVHRMQGSEFDLPEERAEAIRFKIFDAWRALIGEEPITREGVRLRGYPEISADPAYLCEASAGCRPFPGTDFGTKQAGEKRILFIGTSQTFGAGAADLNSTFFAKTYALLRESHPKLTALNIAISGSHAKKLYEIFAEKYAGAYQPDLTVINLAWNGSADILREYIPKFLRLNAQAHRATVLVLEPINDEAEPAPVAERHAILSDAAKAQGVPTLNLYGSLSQSATADSGELWVDIIHLSSWGHELAARWLAPQLLRQLH